MRRFQEYLDDLDKEGFVPRSGSHAVRGHDKHGKRNGHRPTTNEGSINMSTTPVTSEQLGQLETVVNAGGIATPAGQAALRAQKTAEYAARWCPICGAEKGAPKDGAGPYVVCFVHNTEYAEAMQRHRAALSDRAREIALALRARALSPVTLRPPSQLAWTLGKVMPELKRFEAEADDALRIFNSLDAQVKREMEEITGGEFLGQEVQAELLKQIRDGIPGLREAYYGKLKPQGRLAAARALIARCEAEGIKPAVFFAVDQLPVATTSAADAVEEIPVAEAEATAEV